MSNTQLQQSKEVALSEIRPSNPFGSISEAGTGGGVLAMEQHRAIAEVQGMMIIAKKFPRDERGAVDRILNSFSRPSLAEVAKYQYARGGTEIDGPSIRAAEAIAQQWGHIDYGFNEISRGIGADNVAYSEIHAYAWDMQSNTRRSVQFRVRHWRDTKKGGYPITDERDIYELTANMAQRRVRSCILATVPGDVIESAMKQAEITLKTTADTSPEAIGKLLEAFAGFGVTKEQIEKRIQRRMDAIVPAQVVSLRKIFASLRDGMSNPDEWFEPDENGGSGKTTDIASMRSQTKPKPQEKAQQQEQPSESEKPAEAAQTSTELFDEKPTGNREEPTVLTYAQVADQIERSKDLDVLELAGENIQFVQNPDQSSELMKIYQRKKEELEAK